MHELVLALTLTCWYLHIQSLSSALESCCNDRVEVGDKVEGLRHQISVQRPVDTESSHYIVDSAAQPRGLGTG